MGVFIVSLGEVVAEQTQGRRGVVVSVRDTKGDVVAATWCSDQCTHAPQICEGGRERFVLHCEIGVLYCTILLFCM